MEVAAFHPPFRKERRLVSVALFLAFTAVFDAAAYSGRALPGILLCGARTFLHPRMDSDGPAGFGPLFYAVGIRQATVSPAQSGTSVSSPYGYACGTGVASRTSVIVSSFRARP